MLRISCSLGPMSFHIMYHCPCVPFLDFAGEISRSGLLLLGVGDCLRRSHLSLASRLIELSEDRLTGANTERCGGDRLTGANTERCEGEDGESMLIAEGQSAILMLHNIREDVRTDSHILTLRYTM